MLEVERWAEIRRMRFVERLSIREIARRTSLRATPSLYQPPIVPGGSSRRHAAPPLGRAPAERIPRGLAPEAGVPRHPHLSSGTDVDVLARPGSRLRRSRESVSRGGPVCGELPTRMGNAVPRLSWAAARQRGLGQR